MNNVKKFFSIRDLENLSGIKAHTIRIWEKRYGLLTPERTTTNIRTYNINNLQKLLNITLLNNNGYKISKIAKISEENFPFIVREIVAKSSVKNHAINALKLSMVNFDQALFKNTYNNLLNDKSFREIFKDIFIPFLHELGLLWQTDTINPAHEHFVTALIKQKIIINTEKLQNRKPTKKDKVFVPFLPENEIHEIGLLYLNYEITFRGYKSIYLGQTVPLDTLKDVMKYFDNLYFLSYFTVVPSRDKIGKYIHDFSKIVQDYNNPKFWILGHQTQHLDEDSLPPFVKTFDSIEKVIAEL